MNCKQRAAETLPALVITGAFVVLILTLILIVTHVRRSPVASVSNYRQCVDAGGQILESYPERCLIRNTSFTNDANQSVEDDRREYIGLTEEEALSLAKKKGIAARVVERDNELFPITMDFSAGRHNFFITDGKVYKVDIEGIADDSAHQ